MAGFFHQAISWFYTGLAVYILGLWSLLVLAGVAFTAADPDPGFLQLIALPSLLTFLVAKLIVVVAAAAASTPTTTAARETALQGTTTTISGAQTPSSGGNLATWIATAGHGSPRGSLVLLLLSATWLLYIARLVFALYIIFLLSDFVALAALLEDTDTRAGRKLHNDQDVRGCLMAALADFEAQSGIRLLEHYVEDPWIAFETLAAFWVAYALLAMYVTAYAFVAMRKVLTTPLEAWARGGEDLTGTQGFRAVETHTPVGERERAGSAAN
ncbi:hypothetical protein CTA2_7710 [Colletotrichum tanaceti]|uniref:Uncharacterized protein n=1 Tax=Colletotrichum tanaceti TaxID=1306861 RepID=A0A4U6XES7_9PEZI|nr:hypothetical protein CTA2_7710 [Colletotrichum tanaceti]TKW53799.1 hypothetical protein CTA1_5918 [Colletotrichum tanaceti]